MGLGTRHEGRLGVLLVTSWGQQSVLDKLSLKCLWTCEVEPRGSWVPVVPSTSLMWYKSLGDCQLTRKHEWVPHPSPLAVHLEARRFAYWAEGMGTCGKPEVSFVFFKLCPAPSPGLLCFQDWRQRYLGIRALELGETLREFALKGFLDKSQGKGKSQLRTLTGRAWLTPGETGHFESCSAALIIPNPLPHLLCACQSLRSTSSYLIFCTILTSSKWSRHHNSIYKKFSAYSAVQMLCSPQPSGSTVPCQPRRLALSSGRTQAKDYQPFKTCFWEFRVFEHKPPIFLAWPAIALLCSKK